MFLIFFKVICSDLISQADGPCKGGCKGMHTTNQWEAQIYIEYLHKKHKVFRRSHTFSFSAAFYILTALTVTIFKFR
jgi:hypothetical protein